MIDSPIQITVEEFNSLIAEIRKLRDETHRWETLDGMNKKLTDKQDELIKILQKQIKKLCNYLESANSIIIHDFGEDQDDFADAKHLIEQSRNLVN